MRVSIALATMLVGIAAASPCFAADAPAPAAEVQPPDPRTEIKLTLGQLQSILAAQDARTRAEVAALAAAPATKAVQEQISKPPAP